MELLRNQPPDQVSTLASAIRLRVRRFKRLLVAATREFT